MVCSQDQDVADRHWPGAGALAAELERLAAQRQQGVDEPYGLVMVGALPSLLSADGSPAARERFAAVGAAMPGELYALGSRPRVAGAQPYPYREPAFAVLVRTVDHDGLGQVARSVRRAAEAVAGGDVSTTHLRSWSPAGDGPVVTGTNLLLAAVRAVVEDQVLPLAHRVRRLEDQLLREGGHTLEEVLSLEERLRRAEHAACHDPATGLLNRRGYEQALVGLQPPYAVAFVDLDDLRALNATPDLFWLAGDEGIAGIARLLAGRDARDLVVRWGGDEYLVLFPALEASDATHALVGLLERCRRELIIGGRSVTFSAGVAEATAAVTHAEALELAQAAVKLAKQRKNTVVGPDLVVRV